MERKLAAFIVGNRVIIFVFVVGMTVFFGYNALKIAIYTDITDLLPHKHPYVQLNEEFKSVFGGSNIVNIAVRVKKGDIFSPEVLGKVKRITDELIFFPYVDRYKVYSIAHRKIKNILITEWGLAFPPLMWPNVPQSQEEMEELKRNIFTNDTIYGTYVSYDNKAALISAEFFPKGIDYKVLFKRFMAIREQEEDDNTEILIVGDPIVYGYITHYLKQTFIIFLATFAAIVILLFIYTGSIRFMILPVLSALLATIWGVGFAGLLGFNLDPLILVVPLLITARVLSHSVQFNERFTEEYIDQTDLHTACLHTTEALIYPGLSGVITDGAGIFVIAVIPIPILQKLAIICFFWAMSTIFVVLILTPVMLISLPVSKRLKYKARSKAVQIHPSFFFKMLEYTSQLSRGRNAYRVLGVVFILFLGAFVANTRLTIGDARPGTPLLWPDSRFNQDEQKIGEHFPGVNNPLTIIVKGKTEEAIPEIPPVKEPSSMEAMWDFQWYLTETDEVVGCISIVNLVKKIMRVFYEDIPKWEVIPNTPDRLGMVVYMMEGGGAEPGDFDKYVKFDYSVSNITAYVIDRKGDTIRQVISNCEAIIGKLSEKYGKNLAVEFKLAAGLVGCRAASNEEIGRSQVTLLALALVITTFFCALFFRSIVAGLILIVPLTLANFFVFAYMALTSIGLNINTLPVASIAIGIGVDYGIYLLGRIREENLRLKDLSAAIKEAILTTGMAITFTATCIIVGVVFWVFSDIRFQAEMGVLLAIVTSFHLLGTMILLPSLIAIVKPKFLFR